VRFNPVPSDADIRQEAVRLITCELERKAQELQKADADGDQAVYIYLYFNISNLLFNFFCALSKYFCFSVIFAFSNGTRNRFYVHVAKLLAFLLVKIEKFVHLQRFCVHVFDGECVWVHISTLTNTHVIIMCIYHVVAKWDLLPYCRYMGLRFQ
jgi:hypothetical protein